MQRKVFSWGILVLGIGVVGCNRPQPTVAPTKEPEVIVDKPIQQLVTDYEDFTGRTAAWRVVEIRARVNGYLEKIHFKDGDTVSAGQALFDIDPGTYQPELERAAANVELAKAHMIRLKRDLELYTNPATKGSISELEVNRIRGDLAEAEASLKVAEKQRDLAQKSVDYLHIKAPISGKISKRNVDPGALVKADDTILTTIYDTETLYINFDIDDRTELRVKRLIANGSMASQGLINRVVQIGLPDKEGFSLEAPITFEDPQFYASTGTKRFRAELKSPPAGSLLSPGLFVRVRVPIGDPRQTLLVLEEAIGTDQTQKYVFVVDENNKVVYKPVSLGLQFGKYRAIDTNLDKTVTINDRVIVSGMQRVRNGMTVRPKPKDEPKEVKK